MFIFRYLEQVRKKPLAERQRVAVSATILFVAIIALVWAALTIFRFGALGGATAAPAAQQEASKNIPSGIRGPYD